MKMLTRCLNYLTESHILFSHSVHHSAVTARDVASAERMPAESLAKTVIYAGDSGYGMAVVSADCMVDFEELRRLLGLTGVRLATEDEIAMLFPDCELGAMPPLGGLFGMPVLMDENLATTEFIAFNAGTHRDVIHMSGVDFHKLVNPLVAAFALKEQAARRF